MTPICLECGRTRPADREETWCVPCANTGHSCRLCDSMDDAIRRYRIWTAYYNNHDFSLQQRMTIPSFQRLLQILFRGL